MLRFNGLSSSMIFLLCLVSFSGCRNIRGFSTLKKIKTIEIGMGRSEVIEILGERDSHYEYEDGESAYLSLSYTHPIVNASMVPSILMCRDSEIVVGVTLDEGR